MSKATSALLAMTAFDTTNLRLAVTVPAHGMVLFHIRCMLEGATTFPQILLGVLNGATVVGRVAPMTTLDGTALATTFAVCEAEFTVTGLTPGATNFDAAYGVETIVASTNIKYGGPNNTTANDAFGGFVFEAWDPQPQQTNGQLVVDANGRVDVSHVTGTAQTARDLGAQLDAAVSTRLAPTVGGRTLDVTAAGEAGIDLDNAAGTLAKGTELTGFNDLDAAGIRAAAGLAAANLDTQLATIDGDVGTRAAPGDVMALTAAAIDAILDDPSEGALTARQMLRIILAATAGKADGFPAGPVHYRDQADGKNRITATVDANGNRSAIAVDGT